MSARSRKQTIQTTIETRDYDSSAPLNEFDLAPLTLVLRNVQGLERRPLVVLRQDVQTASVVRVDTNMYVVPLVSGAVHSGAMHERQRAVRNARTSGLTEYSLVRYLLLSLPDT